MTDLLDLPYVPMTVYYLHYEDERFTINNWSARRDYVCCVMARTQQEAIEKVNTISANQRGHKYIKIMGFGHAKQEWVNEESPLDSDESYYANIANKVFESINTRKLSPQDIYKGLEKQKYSFE